MVNTYPRLAANYFPKIPLSLYVLTYEIRVSNTRLREIVTSRTKIRKISNKYRVQQFRFVVLPITFIRAYNCIIRGHPCCALEEARNRKTGKRPSVKC